ncbi:MAG: hypothetical protein K6T83_09505, partial [Alicyclobacillus sp.]|nr:hypothetical protein [Alicyclobacillus sp.]
MMRRTPMSPLLQQIIQELTKPPAFMQPDAKSDASIRPSSGSVKHDRSQRSSQASADGNRPTTPTSDPRPSSVHRPARATPATSDGDVVTTVDQQGKSASESAEHSTKKFSAAREETRLYN